MSATAAHGETGAGQARRDEGYAEAPAHYDERGVGYEETAAGHPLGQAMGQDIDQDMDQARAAHQRYDERYDEAHVERYDEAPNRAAEEGHNEPAPGVNQPATDFNEADAGYDEPGVGYEEVDHSLRGLGPPARHVESAPRAGFLGPDEPEKIDILAAPHAEARQRAESGDLTGARTMLEEALAAGELRLGRDHPRLAPLMVDLATIARNLGNLTEAQSQLRRAYGLIVAAAGPDHPTALSIEGRLAAVTYRLGEPTEPYDWHLADIGGRILGPDHPAIRGALQRLAMGRAHTEDPTPETPPPDPGHGFPAYDPTYSPGHDPGHGFPAYEYEEPTDNPGYAQQYVPSDHAAGVYDRRQDTSVDPARPMTTGPAGRTTSGTTQGATPGTTQGTTRGTTSGSTRGDPEGIYVVGPPPRTYKDVEVWQEPPLPPGLPETRPRRRGHGGGVALVASLGATVIVAGVVIAMQLFGPRAPSQGTPQGPPAAETPGATEPAPTTPPAAEPLPPAGVALKDDGGSVTLTWVDPSAGRVPFIVAGGRVGAASTPLETIPVGRTTSTIYGLNIRFDYCFTVAAVWSAEVVAPSIRTCTHRLPTPSAT